MCGLLRWQQELGWYTHDRNYERKQTQQALRQGVLFRQCNDAAFAAFMEVCTMMAFKSGSQIIDRVKLGPFSS